MMSESGVKWSVSGPGEGEGELEKWTKFESGNVGREPRIFRKNRRKEKQYDTYYAITIGHVLNKSQLRLEMRDSCDECTHASENSANGAAWA